MITGLLFAAVLGQDALRDLPDDTWVHLKPARNPVGRSYSGVGGAVGGGYIFYFGGGHGSHPGNDVELYDIVANAWVQATEVETPPAGSEEARLIGGGSSPGYPARSPRGRPWVLHTYQLSCWVPGKDAFLGVYASGVWLFDPRRREWARLEALSKAKPVTGDVHTKTVTYDPDQGDPVYIANSKDTEVFIVDLSESRWVKKWPIPEGVGWSDIYTTYDSARKRHVVWMGSKGNRWWTLDMAAGRWKPMRDLAEVWRASEARKRLEGLGPEERRSRLRETWARLLGTVEPPLEPKPRKAGKETLGTIAVERLVLETGAEAPALLLHPSPGKRVPLVVAFAQDGKEAFLRKRSRALADLLAGGAAVMLPDLRGTGETRIGGPGRTSGRTSLSSTELMLGETIQRIHDGAIGNIVALQANDYRSGRWAVPRRPEWSDMTWHMRNWYNFTWLSGDFNVEQHVHFLDVCAWAMRDEYPVRAIGMGGRQVLTGPEYGNIYDHFSVVYEYANGAKLFSNTRQHKGCMNEMSSVALGSKGQALISEGRIRITGPNAWERAGKDNDFYQAEHDELFASIRSGKPINNGDYMAKGTLLAIMGRMAAYTGQAITWEQAFNSKENLGPAGYDWNLAMETPPVAMPGLTRFF